MSASKEQRLLLKLRWLREERTAVLEERQKYMYDIHRAMSYIRQNVKEANVAPKQDANSQIKPEIVSSDVEHDDDNKVLSSPELKKIFREITKKTHPDAIYHDKNISDAQKDYLTNLFMKAKSAFENQDTQTLYEIALDLEISIEKSSDDIFDLLTKSTTAIENEINKIKDTVGWMWGINHGNHPIRIKILQFCCNSQFGFIPPEDILLTTIKFCEGTLEFEAEDRFGRKVNVVTRPAQFVGRPPGNPIKALLERKKKL